MMDSEARFQRCLERFRDTVYSRTELDRLSREAGSQEARDAAYCVLREREERSEARKAK
jgi:hypothetical protein